MEEAPRYREMEEAPHSREMEEVPHSREMEEAPHSREMERCVLHPHWPRIQKRLLYRMNYFPFSSPC